MNAAGVKVPVELSGGPLCGHRDAVGKPVIETLDVHLFERVMAGERLRCAYKWTGRTTGKGRRWVLEFFCVVSRWRVSGSAE